MVGNGGEEVVMEGMDATDERLGGTPQTWVSSGRGRRDGCNDSRIERFRPVTREICLKRAGNRETGGWIDADRGSESSHRRVDSIDV